MWTNLKIRVSLILWVGRKWKGWAGDNCKSVLITINIGFEQDWFRRYVRRQIENKKYIFLFTRIFSGKADSAIFLGFECTINLENLMKIVGAIFEKMKILKFFHMWTTFNFGGRSKTKKWARLVSWFRRYVTWHRKLKTIFLVSMIFREKPIVSNCWGWKVR